MPNKKQWINVSPYISALEWKYKALRIKRGSTREKRQMANKEMTMLKEHWLSHWQQLVSPAAKPSSRKISQMQKIWTTWLFRGLMKELLKATHWLERKWVKWTKEQLWTKNRSKENMLTFNIIQVFIIYSIIAISII